MPSYKIKLVTPAQLRAINNKGIKLNFNRLLSDEALDAMPPEGMFVLQYLQDHEFIDMKPTDILHYRCVIYPMDKAKQGQLYANLDVLPEDYDALPAPEWLGLQPVYKKS